MAVTFDDVNSDCPELTKEADKLLDLLRNAESCESKEDLVSNLLDALDTVSALKNDIRSLLKRAQMIKENSEDCA